MKETEWVRAGELAQPLRVLLLRRTPSFQHPHWVTPEDLTAPFWSLWAPVVLYTNPHIHTFITKNKHLKWVSKEQRQSLCGGSLFGPLVYHVKNTVAIVFPGVEQGILFSFHISQTLPQALDLLWFLLWSHASLPMKGKARVDSDLRGPKLSNSKGRACNLHGQK